MFQEKYVFRRCVWLLVTAWCAATAIPGRAGRPATPDDAAAQSAAAARQRDRSGRCFADESGGELAANDLIPTTELLARADQAAKPRRPAT